MGKIYQDVVALEVPVSNVVAGKVDHCLQQLG
jgi:hypothetical protein